MESARIVSAAPAIFAIGPTGDEEVGFGNGANIELLAGRAPNGHVVGAEVSETAVEMASKKNAEAISDDARRVTLPEVNARLADAGPMFDSARRTLDGAAEIMDSARGDVTETLVNIRLASQQAGLAEVPVVIREVDDRTVVAMALIENIQREDLNPLEEAQALQRLIDEFDLTQRKISCDSPLGRALLGKPVDSDIQLDTPQGPANWTLISVEYTE